MALKEDYIDDVLDTSVNTKRKFNMITNEDGTISLEDVTVYSKNGDNFGAKDINETNIQVNLSVKSTVVKKIELVDSIPDDIVDGTVYFTFE